MARIVPGGDKAWFGWPNSPKVQDGIARWYGAPDAPTEETVMDQLDKDLMDFVTDVPTDFFLPVFWGVCKS